MGATDGDMNDTFSEPWTATSFTSMCIQGLRAPASFRNAMSQRMKMWDAVSIIRGYKDRHKSHGLPNFSDFTMNCHLVVTSSRIEMSRAGDLWI